MAWGRGFARRRRRRGRVGLGGALAGLAAGAGLAYFLDPARGPARRARTIDRARRVAHEAERTAASRARDLGHRARGAAHEARARAAHEQVADEVLVERVRARLGRLVAHPHAIEVVAREGKLELSGAVFRVEHARLLRAVRLVRGVKTVDDRLRPHDDAAGVPALRGRGPLAATAGGAGWPAGATAFAVAIGSAAAARALLGRRLLGIPAVVAGAALARGATHGSRSRARRRHPAREEAREADRARDRAREEEREREAHSGAWHPEPEVREVKSPAELEPGIAHGAPEPTFPDRVSRRRGGGPAPRARRRTPDAGEVGDPSAAQQLPRSGYLSPAPGSGVHESELGAVPGPDEEPEPGEGEGGDQR